MFMYFIENCDTWGGGGGGEKGAVPEVCNQNFEKHAKM